MKSVFFTLVMVLVLVPGIIMAQQVATGDEYVNFSFISQYDNQGIPGFLERETDETDLTFLADIDSSLPDNIPVLYVDPNIETDLVLKSDADIWLTFIHEDTRYQNAIGFYTYDICNKPVTSLDIKSHVVVFPNFSLDGKGGKMFNGYRIKLGKFRENTGIGWFLVPDSWDSTLIMIPGKEIRYSDSRFNTNQESYVILLKDPVRKRYVVGFEDGDKMDDQTIDFNDALFSVTVSPYNAVYSNNIALIANSKAPLEAVEDTPGPFNDTANMPDEQDSETGTGYEKCDKEGIDYRDFNNLKATIIAEPSDPRKKIIIKQSITNYQLTANQVKELLFLLTMENDKIEVVEYLFDYTCEEDKLNPLVTMFESPSNQKKFEALLKEKQGDNNSYSNPSDPPGSRIDDIPSACGSTYSEKEFKKIRRKVRSMNFSNERYIFIEEAVQEKCFNLEQVREIIGLFQSELDRFEAAKFLFNHTPGKDNYSELVDLFQWDTTKNDFKEFLEDK